jgi:hypothetical protein
LGFNIGYLQFEQGADSGTLPGIFLLTKILAFDILASLLTHL